MAKNKEVYIRYNNERLLQASDISDFVYRSKKLGFARTDLKVSQSDGSSLYSNRELPWLYTDTYCGNTIERGFEDVYYDMVLAWSMQYRGGCYEPYWANAEMISGFLKEALMQIPQEFPVRGPKEFSLSKFEYNGEPIDGIFTYRNQWDGSFIHFVGHEFIYWNGAMVYFHDYMGGIVRNKYFPMRSISDKPEGQIDLYLPK